MVAAVAILCIVTYLIYSSDKARRLAEEAAREADRLDAEKAAREKETAEKLAQAEKERAVASLRRKRWDAGLIFLAAVFAGVAIGLGVYLGIQHAALTWPNFIGRLVIIVVCVLLYVATLFYGSMMGKVLAAFMGAMPTVIYILHLYGFAKSKIGACVFEAVLVLAYIAVFVLPAIPVYNIPALP
jgi:Flp pilus assembly protein TadB